jgi:hypothetical protein
VIKTKLSRITKGQEGGLESFGQKPFNQLTFGRLNVEHLVESLLSNFVFWSNVFRPKNIKLSEKNNSAH